MTEGWQSEEWRDKAGEAFRVEKRLVYVPEHHHRHARELALALWRLPCERPSLPPLLFLVGGPGERARDWLPHPPFRAALSRLAESRELLILDQRGNDWQVEPISPDGEFWSSPERALAALRDQAQRTLLASPERDPRAIHPYQSARDLSCLNLGEFDLLATSYGTHLAMAYMKQGAPGLRRAVFLGFEGPDQTLKLPSRTELQLEILEVVLELPLRDWLTQQEWWVKWIASSLIGTSNRWQRLPEFVKDPAKFQAGFLKMLNRRSASYYLNDAASGASAARLRRIRQEAPGTALEDWANFPFPRAAEFWNQARLPAWFRRTTVWSGPLLVCVGELDGFTPKENVLDDSEGFSSMALMTLEGIGHSDYLNHPGAMAAVDGFLRQPQIGL